jgi:hypothetical protein
VAGKIPSDHLALAVLVALLCGVAITTTVVLGYTAGQLVASFSRSSNLSVIRAGTGFVIGEGRSVRVQMFGLSE